MRKLIKPTTRSARQNKSKSRLSSSKMKQLSAKQLDPRSSELKSFIYLALKVLAIIVICLTFIPRVRALYEDQRGKFDWRKQFIGIPKFVHFDSDKSIILIGTESDVLASIRANDGQILWRKLMPSQCNLKQMSVLKSTINKRDNYIVRTTCRDSNDTQFWHADNGLLVSDAQYEKFIDDEDASTFLADSGSLEGDNRSFPLALGETLVVSADGTVSSLVNDEVQWSREESLASIVAVEIVHLPVEERDPFGLKKIIVVVTAQGKVFGIDSITGDNVWQYYDKDLATNDKPASPKAKLIILNQSDEADHRAIVFSPTGCSIMFNPVDGKVLEKNHLNNQIKQIAQTEIFSPESGRAIIVLDSRDMVHIYPKELVDQVKMNLDKYYLTVIDRNPDILRGYNFMKKSDGRIVPNIAWTFSIEESEKIVSVQMKRIDEEVHSPARVLGDRGMLYKYVNPNLVAVMTKKNSGTECNPENNLVIYLIDTVTGALVHSIFHPKSREPVNIVHSENWLVYSFYNIKYRRTEISSLELFEGPEQANSSFFSSISRSGLKPKIIEQKTFIFPSGINVMSDTTTLRGMTNKHLIVSLPSGGLLEIPKIFLDPRRPIVMTMDHREEGLIPYAPELPIPSESIINYDQPLLRIRGVSTSPAMLESTSLVFAYGLDVFFTRVTPSKTFDILKDDFDHVLITGVLISLIIATYVTKLLAQRKALHAVWK